MFDPGTPTNPPDGWIDNNPEVDTSEWANERDDEDSDDSDDSEDSDDSDD